MKIFFKTGFFIVSSIGVTFLLTGCLKTRDQIESMDVQRSNQTQITTAQQSKADSESKLYAMQDELRNIMGRLESLERRQTEATEKGPAQQELVEQMKIFEQTIAGLKSKIETLEAQLQNSSTKIIGEVSGAAVLATKNSEWDLAEDLFNKKEWKNAILKYQAYRDQYPKGSQYAMATYKIGVCFQELKMKEEAKAFLEEVLQKYPKSPTAKKAKFRLNQMK